MVFHLGPLAPRPALGHVDTEPSRPATRRRRHGERGRRPAHGRHRHRRGRPRRDGPRGVLGPPGQRRTATRRITFFDPSRFRSRIAAECDFDPAARRARRGGGRPQRPVHPVRPGRGGGGGRDSGLDFARRRDDPRGSAVSLGTAVGGTTRLEHEYVVGQRRRAALGRRPALRRAVPLPGARAQQPRPEVADRFGAHGPVQVVSTGCTSGIDAVGYAFQHIEEGRADVCIAGASDSPISPITMACFDAIKATSPSNDDPAHASRPFDATGTGSSWARARRCWSWRSWSTPGAAARTSTARSAATPPAATPTT